jgi:hypothetical protein
MTSGAAADQVEVPAAALRCMKPHREVAPSISPRHCQNISVAAHASVHTSPR